MALTEEPPIRPAYVEGQILDLETLESEQAYRIRMRSWHERSVHGALRISTLDAEEHGYDVAASAIRTPSGTGLALGATAVRFPEHTQPGHEVVTITPDGCTARATVTVRNVETSVLRLGSSPKPSTRPDPWRWYRVLTEQEDGRRALDSRIELEPPLLPGAPDRSRWVVGTRRKQSFAPLLSVDAAGNSVVHGQLVVRGPVVHATQPGEPTASDPPLVVSVQPTLNSKGKEALMVWVGNMGEKRIAGLSVTVAFRRSGELATEQLTIFPVLKAGGSNHQTVDRVAQARSVAVHALGVLPGGVLCHATNVLDL